MIEAGYAGRRYNRGKVLRIMSSVSQHREAGTDHPWPNQLHTTERDVAEFRHLGSFDPFKALITNPLDCRLSGKKPQAYIGLAEAKTEQASHRERPKG